MKINFALSFFLVLFSVQAFSQDRYQIHLKSGSIAPSANFDALLLNRPDIDPSEAVHQHYTRLIQFNEIPTNEARAKMEALGLQFEGYIDFGAYVTAIPVGFDISSLANYSVRSIIPMQASWKVQDRVLDPFAHDWAIDGEYLKVIISLYPHVDLKTGALILANDLLAEQIQIEGEHLIARVHRNRIWQVAELAAVAYIELIQPPGTPEDVGGQSLHRSSMLDGAGSLGPKFTGTGVGVQVRDDGAVGAHIDFQGRLNNIATNFGPTHGDGVAGIMAGAGNLNPDNRGMAAGATVFVTNYNSSFTDQTLSLHQTQGVMVTNSSYSDGCNDGYTTATRTVDNQIFQNTSLMHVFSAGNSNSTDCGYGAGDQWGNITGGHKQGKNCIATANLSVTATIASSSSRGPAHDGRLKPDIAAHGAGQISTDEDNTYMSFGGTSAAAPGIAGCMAQLYEAYRAWHNGTSPESALIKASMLNTANDLGNTGPDFIFGWGHVNTWKAFKLLENNRYWSGTISQGQTQNQTLTIPSGVKQAKIMLYWADPAAAVNASKALVNDLDLKLINGASVASLPWKLNPAPNATTLAQPAGLGRDSLNNVEQVSITNPAAGTYTVEVKGFGVPIGPQKYWIVVEYIMDEIKVIYPNGGEGITPGQTARIHWDAPVVGTSFTLKYSTNNGGTWTTIGTSGATTRLYTWTVPNVQSGEVLISVENGSLSDVSDTVCTITSLVAGVEVFKLCPTEATVIWRKHAQATQYEVFKLGAKYMESIGVTTDTFLVFAHAFNPNQPLWVSVRPILANKYPGRRTNAIMQNTLKACSVIADLSMNQIIEPAGALKNCGASIAQPITIRVKNESINPISGAVAYYQLNNGPILQENLADIAGSATLNHTFAQPILISQNGTNTLKTWVFQAQDQLRFNDTLLFSFTAIVQSVTGPTAESFTNGVPPSGWEIFNADTSYTWQLANVTQKDGATGRAAFMDFYSYADRGEQDRLITLPTYITPQGTPMLKFDLAHARYDANYTDGLQVLLYQGCDLSGQPIKIFEKLDPTLATVPATTTEFTPTAASQWRSEVIDLTPYLGDTVTFVFNALNDYGNNLYIDNIQIDQTTPVLVPQAGIQSAFTTLCQSQTQTLSAITGANVNANYLWVLPNSTFLQGPGPHNFQFAGTGAQSVQLIVSNGFGADTATQVYQVNPNTVAAFTSATSAFSLNCTNTSINYTSSSWSFGDGATSTEANPAHTYAQNGTYTVSLTVVGPCGQQTFTQVVTINVGFPPSASIISSAQEICVGQTLNLQAANQTLGVTYIWNFNGGTNAASGSQGGTIAAPYTQIGQFTVQMIAVNAFGSDTAFANVSVLPGVSAAFAVGANQNQITITNNSANASSYLWNFGDGTVSTEVAPTHTYAQSGTYTVTLISSGNCGTATATQVVNAVLLLPPVLNWSVSRDTACVFDQILFNASPSGNTTADITWNFDIGAQPNSTATGAGAQTVWYNQAGQYQVVIVASNAAGSDTARQTITVLPPPTAAFTANAQGYEVQFTNTSILGQSYSWNFGDGSQSVEANPTHTYTQNGTYQVVLTVQGKCGSNSVTFPVTINIVLPPVVSIASSTDTICQNGNAQLTASSPTATSIDWFLNLASPSIAQGAGPINIPFTLAGNYTVYAVATNAAGKDTANYQILVLPLPNVDATASIQVNQVQFNAQTTNAIDILWDFGDGTTSTQAVASHLYSANGNFLAICTASNGCGSVSDTVSISVQVSPPSAAILSSATDTICLSETVQFTGLTPPDVLITDWVWSFGAGANPATATGIGPHSVVFGSGGTQNVSLTVSNFAGSNTVNYVVTAEAPPVIDYAITTSDLTISIIDQSTGVGQYSWTFGDGASSNLQNPTHTYSQAGTYIVTLVVNHRCGVFTETRSVTVETSGVLEPGDRFSAEVNPNPAQGEATLTVVQSGLSQDGFIRIYANDGRLVMERNAVFTEGKTQIPMQLKHLAPGVYTCHVRLGEASTQVQIVVIR